MMDPGRLAARDSTPFEIRLLSAARSESIPTEMRLRMSRGLQLGAAATGGGATAVLSLNTVALVVLGAAAVAGLAGVILKQSGESHSPRAAVAITEPVHTTLAETTPTQPVNAANPKTAPIQLFPPEQLQPNAAPAPARAPASDTPAPPSPATRNRDVDLREEIAFLDAARAALAAGAPNKAMGVLARYHHRYPNGTFAPESLALRIDALTDAGDTALARTLARRFLKAHPDSPLAERMEQLVASRP